MFVHMFYIIFQEKCDHYWPVDSEPMFYGDLQVQILNETKCPTWIVTEFTIAMVCSFFENEKIYM